MRFATSIIAAVLASSVSGAALHCKKHNLDPFCCQDTVNVPIAGVTIGVGCNAVKGHATCSSGTSKQCCSKENISLIGLVVVCNV